MARNLCGSLFSRIFRRSAKIKSHPKLSPAEKNPLKFTPFLYITEYAVALSYNGRLVAFISWRYINKNVKKIWSPLLLFLYVPVPNVKYREENCCLKMRENLFPTVKSEIQICENFFPRNAQNCQCREIFLPHGNPRDVMRKCKDTTDCHLQRHQFLNLPHDSIKLKNSQKKPFHSSINKPN